MADHPTPAMGAINDVLSLRDMLRPGWEEKLRRLRASGVPLNADGGDGGSGGDASGAGTGSAAGDAAAAAGAAAGAAAAATDDDTAALGAAGKAALDAERKARRDAERRAAAAEKEAKEFKDRDLTEQQKLEQRAATAEGKITPLEQENARLKVALQKGLTGDRAFLADRLRGSTEEELAADADELLKQFGGAGTGRSSFDGGARGNAPVSDMDTLIRQQAGFA